jgi:chromosome segregation ATPase
MDAVTSPASTMSAASLDEVAATALVQDCQQLQLKLAEMIPLCEYLQSEMTRLAAQNDLLQTENDSLRKLREMSALPANTSVQSSVPASPRPTSSPTGSLKRGDTSELKQRLHSANVLNQTQIKQHEFDIKRLTLDRDMLKAQLEREMQQKILTEREKKRMQTQQRDYEIQIEKQNQDLKSLERKYKNLERQKLEMSTLLQTEEKNFAKLQEKMLRQAQFHKKEVERLLDENRTEVQSIETHYKEEIEQEKKKARKEVEKMTAMHQRAEEQFQQESKLLGSFKKEIESVEADKKELERKEGKEIKRSSSFTKKRSFSTTTNPTPKLANSLLSPNKPKQPPFK